MDRFAVARSKTTTTTTTGNIKSPGCRRSKKKAEKGIKVVYISNPMKVKASASEFRALVQELTGQDSDPAELVKLLDLDRPDAEAAAAAAANYGDYPPRPAQPSMVPVVLPDAVEQAAGGETHASGTTYNPFDDSQLEDDVFTPQMVESFNGFFPSSIFYHESQMEMLRGLDAV